MTQTDLNGYALNTKARAALQELLKYGWVEQSYKPNIYQSLLTNLLPVNHALEPLDLVAKVDDIRGLVFVAVAPPVVDEIASQGTDSQDGQAPNLIQPTDDIIAQFNADDWEWSHPLIRRQRLTLEQSLLLAILRQRYIEAEQHQGVGSGNIIAELDDIQSQLQLYLDTSGSDSTDERKIRTLLEQLANHGVVSKIDDNDEIKIRPLIAHLANPENLSRLLKQIKTLKNTPPSNQ